MAAVAEAEQLAAVLALGDNFYPHGICNRRTHPPCAAATSDSGTSHDVRFQHTFEDIYSAPSLRSVPWHPIAGNHDALGNVTAQILYSALNPRWQFPGHYYVLQWALGRDGWRRKAPNEGAVEDLTVAVIMLDTTLWWGVFNDHFHAAQGVAQWRWLRTVLAAAAAEADFLWVAGHYPIYGACIHGSVTYLIDRLLPLLKQYRATGYLSGHDHCLEDLRLPVKEDGVGSWQLRLAVSGAGSGCCYNETFIHDVAPAQVEFLLSAGLNP
eukprot:EG_transcript_20192